MLSSEIAGVPAAGTPIAVCPGDWSVTVPRIAIGEPTVTPLIGASTVVWLNPLP